MIIRGETLGGRLAALLVLMGALAACGGGGGGGGSDSAFFPEETEIKLTLFDPNGEKTNTVTESAPGTLQAKVGSRGNIVVNLSSNIGTVIPASGSALTNSNGIATFQIEANGERGAGTLVATAATDNGIITGNLSFQVGDSGLRIGFFDEDGQFRENEIFIEPKSTLAAGGNAQFSVVVLDSEGNRVTTAEEVRFNSGCIGSGQSLINPQVPITTNGQASTLYTAAGCAGLDEISASVVGAAAQAFGNINVAAPSANAISFTSADPRLIVLRGTGGEGRDETTDVIFTVVDGTGAPLPGITVNFSLTTEVGGLSLSTQTALSNGDGQVQVTVQAGDVATVVRVLASIIDSAGNEISTVSDLITVTTGLPDQNSISLGVADCGDGAGFIVANGNNINGLCRQVTVRMSDKFNNPVVDGTAAVFTTEYGSIEGSCTTVNGECSVLWSTQAPRFPTLTGADFVRTIFDPDYSCPSHNGSSGACPDDLGFTRGLRSTVLVQAIGEESFVDRNGNGILDEEEQFLFSNLPEAFVDHNEDGVFTPAIPECAAAPFGSARCVAGAEENFIDFNNNSTYDLNDDPAVYNGLLCPPEGDGVWCSRELVHVRDDVQIIMSDADSWSFVVAQGGQVRTSLVGPDAVASAEVYIADTYNNAPPSGSTVTISTDGNCEVVGQSSFTVPVISAPGAITFGFTVEAPEVIAEEDNPGRGTVDITLAPVAGLSVTETIECVAPVDCTTFPDDARPAECPEPPAPDPAP